MRALVYTRPNTVELLEIDQPVAGAAEVLVRVDAAGICGSELHGISDTSFRRPPLVMGHEFSGTTLDGRRVVANPLLSCGDCDQCERGCEHLCRSRAILGIHRPGAFAEWIAVPERALHELPAAMSFETAALIEPLANGVHAVNLSNGEPDARIAIFGAGTIGLVALLAARRRSDRVAVCDLSPERLAVAERLGAGTTTTALDGEFDVVIDAVGAASTHRASIEHLRPGGTTVWIGLLSRDADIDAQALVRDEKHVVGSYCYTTADFAEAVALASEIDLGWTTSFDLDDGVTIFNELMHGRHDVVKAVLRPTKDRAAARR
jgi:threonine dehydrogenase-like Zn-dependent dehydrogenase